ncbi:MAG: DMT family transporter [Candidatus Bathyarchaeota archaeon]|nr:DMT family transporter [Candidatus Bathyarchaeota archaeon A05DMB-3]MDH7606976.1 DMT family transporter [Candidatus Bathyarchaeota archaeon]
MGFTKSHGLLVLASFSFSFILVFSTMLKNAGVSSLQQVFYRIILALPLIFLLIRGKFKLEKGELQYFASIGLVFSAFLLSALSSIVFGCPIAVSVALIYTQPLFTALLAAIFGKERITLKKLGIVVVGFLGVLFVSGLITEPLSNLNVGGVGFAFLAGFLYAVYLYLKRVRKTSYSPLQGLFNTFLFAAPCTLLLGSVLRLFTVNPSFVGFSMLDSYQLALLALFAAFSTTLPYGLLNFVKPSEVSPTTEGTILLLDPLLHNLWAVLLFQQYIPLIRYFGVGLILLSAAAMFRVKSI